MRKTDFPRLRAFDICPLCGDAKARGALVCWPCFNSRGIGASDDNPLAEAQFIKAERALRGATEFLIGHMCSVQHGPSIVRPLIDRSA
ncbi:MAG TPA: hypothetical protein VMV19_18250 [Xanthobacteraceae bacterium]|nr:hypothetical protein [Xanthobacteraceae bacterium]